MFLFAENEKNLARIISCRAFFCSTGARGENFSSRSKNHVDATECTRPISVSASALIQQLSMKARLYFRVHRADESEVEKVTRRGRVCVSRRRRHQAACCALDFTPGRTSRRLLNGSLSVAAAAGCGNFNPSVSNETTKVRDRRRSAAGCELMTTLGLVFTGNNVDENPTS